MTEPLDLEKVTFALDFWRDHAEYNPRGIINVDETAINFDIPPAHLESQGTARRER
jgi:hypothetical protein